MSPSKHDGRTWGSRRGPRRRPVRISWVGRKSDLGGKHLAIPGDRETIREASVCVTPFPRDDPHTKTWVLIRFARADRCGLIAPRGGLHRGSFASSHPIRPVGGPVAVRTGLAGPPEETILPGLLAGRAGPDHRLAQKGSAVHRASPDRAGLQSGAQSRPASVDPGAESDLARSA